MCNITEAFKEKFGLWDITINDEDVFVGNKKTIPNGEWRLKWVVQKDERGVFLEYYGVHYLHGHLHEKIYEDGQEERLDALRQYIAYSPNIPGDREKSLREFEKHNTKIIQELERKDLLVLVDQERIHP